MSDLFVPLEMILDKATLAYLVRVLALEVVHI